MPALTFQKLYEETRDLCKAEPKAFLSVPGGADQKIKDILSSINTVNRMICLGNKDVVPLVTVNLVTNGLPEIDPYVAPYATQLPLFELGRLEKDGIFSLASNRLVQCVQYYDLKSLYNANGPYPVKWAKSDRNIRLFPVSNGSQIEIRYRPLAVGRSSGGAFISELVQATDQVFFDSMFQDAITYQAAYNYLIRFDSGSPRVDEYKKTAAEQLDILKSNYLSGAIAPAIRLL